MTVKIRLTSSVLTRTVGLPLSPCGTGLAAGEGDGCGLGACVWATVTWLMRANTDMKMRFLMEDIAGKAIIAIVRWILWTVAGLIWGPVARTAKASD